MSTAVYGTEQQEQRPSFMQRLIDRFAMSPFFAVSVLLHVVLLIIIGGTIIYKVMPETSDFEAGTGGIMSDTGETAPPEPEQVEPNQTFTPAQPTVNAPALSVIATTNANSAFAIEAKPVADNSMKSVSDGSAASMANLAKKIGEGGAGSPGRAGGTAMKKAMIFNKPVEANKLGVILDVSGSAQPLLPGAIKEIEKGFPDAILILYPGCGMTDYKDAKAKELHKIRKFSTVLADLKPDAPAMSTPGQLNKAMKIEEFEKLTKRPNMRDRLYIDWFEGGAHGNLTGSTLTAFDEAIKMGVDAIFWFADFRDGVDAGVAEDLLKRLKAKKIKVHLHNFATATIAPQTMTLAEGTGGTISTTKDEKKDPPKK